jgi:hypothetical protein
MKYSKRLAILLELEGVVTAGVVAGLFSTSPNNKNENKDKNSSDSSDNSNTSNNSNNKDLDFFIKGEQSYQEDWEKSTPSQIYYYLIIRAALTGSEKIKKKAVKESTLDNYSAMIEIFKETIENILEKDTNNGCYSKMIKTLSNIESSQVNKEDFKILSELGKQNLQASITADRGTFDAWYKKNIIIPLTKEKKDE